VIKIGSSTLFVWALMQLLTLIFILRTCHTFTINGGYNSIKFYSCIMYPLFPHSFSIFFSPPALLSLLTLYSWWQWFVVIGLLVWVYCTCIFYALLVAQTLLSTAPSYLWRPIPMFMPLHDKLIQILGEPRKYILVKLR